jgi:lauroyl/myristoyl acyltransferase
MKDWKNISEINQIYCDLNSSTSFKSNVKSKLSKITIARAYCNLIRYYKNKNLCRNILKRSLYNIREFENLNLHAKRFIQKSDSLILKQITKINKNNGNIFISFHFGAFELIPLILAVYLTTTIYVVIDVLTINRQIRLEYYKNLIKLNYPKANIEFILVQDFLSIRKLIKILRNKGVIFIYFDENRSIQNENSNLIPIPFLSGFKYMVRPSIPYILKKTNSSVYSVISIIKGSSFDFKIQFVTASKKEKNEDIFYYNALNLLKFGLKHYPYQWTRWYCVDELDDSSITSYRQNIISDKLKIIDHSSNTKYIIDIKNMKIINNS